MAIIDDLRVRLADVCQLSLTDIPEHKELSDLPGMDSLLFVELMTWAEKRYGVILDERSAVAARTVADLAAVVSATLAITVIARSMKDRLS